MLEGYPTLEWMGNHTGEKSNAMIGGHSGVDARSRFSSCAHADWRRPHACR